MLTLEHSVFKNKQKSSIEQLKFYLIEGQIMQFNIKPESLPKVARKLNDLEVKHTGRFFFKSIVYKPKLIIEQSTWPRPASNKNQ